MGRADALDGIRDPVLRTAVEAALDGWDAARGTHRLHEHDATLWTGADESRWLAWLDPDEACGGLPEWESLAAAAHADGFADAVVVGMGGSSLFPAVIARTFGRRAGWPALKVLDSTDPDAVRAIEGELDLARTLVLVASKSGSTLEPKLLMERLLAQTTEELGPERAASGFVAVTDPGSELESVAQARGFRAVAHGVKAIGGRFSALSAFGMVPALVCGAPAREILASAREMAARCRAPRARENPGASLGCALGVLAHGGRDKVTLVLSPRIAAMGGWIEQLLAESTGKLGVGLVPVDGEELGVPSAYGLDRVFVSMSLDGDSSDARDQALAALEREGHPVLRLAVPTPESIGGLAYRWEVATAVAGAILGVHPFDQPDVEAAKVVARALVKEWERTGRLAAVPPAATSGPVRVHASARTLEELQRLGADRSAQGLLRAHVARAGTGDYFALLAFTPESEGIRRELGSLRHAVRDGRRVATCLGFGPRFLHSTGQLHKGGPDSGVFLQITHDVKADCELPGRAHGLAVVLAAQAAGDLAVLEERGRRVLRVHLEGDVEAGLRGLRTLVGDPR